MRYLFLALILSATPAAAAPSRPDAEGYIRDWLVMAPAFYNPQLPIGLGELDKRHLPREAQLRPTAGATATVEGQKLTWTAYQSPAFKLDFLAHTKLQQKDAISYLGYAVAQLHADQAHAGVQLRFGSNDMAKVFLNGRQVVKHDRPRVLQKDSEVVTVNLQRGTNVLVVKSVNTEQQWEIAARFTTTDGRPVPGLKLDAEGFVREWVVLAPIDYQHRPFAAGVLDHKHVDNEADLRPSPGEKLWVNGHWLPFTPFTAKSFFLDFNEQARTQRPQIAMVRWEANDTLFNAFTYAATYVNAPRDMTVTVLLGANDHGKLYLDGKPVVAIDMPGKLRKDSASAKVTLKKGAHALLLKTVNGGDDWQASVRFVGEGGRAVRDLEITLQPSGPSFATR